MVNSYKPLDFSSADSYASASVNSAWTAGGAGWIPIGGFGATLEGNGLTISNLYISGQSDTGLFGTTVGTIRNIGLLDVEVTGNINVGALVGNNYATIRNSYSTGRVTGTGHGIGGLVGSNLGTVTNSRSAAAVGGSGRHVGGLVGTNSINRSVSLSYSTGAVTGHEKVGGLVGLNYRGTIIESYSKSEVTGSGDHIGGLIGESTRGSVVNVSYATGAVSGGSIVGGLAGSAGGASFTSVYASGAVFGNSYVGGLIGLFGSSRLNSSYAVGSVSGTDNHGGLVGGGSSDIARSYWNTTTSGLTTSVGGVGATTAELQEPTSAVGIYAGWNPRQWDFGSTTQYPALKADMDGDGVATAAEFGGQGRTPPTPPPTPTHTPTPTLPPQAYVDFSMGLGHICLLRNDGVVECSGDNSQGQATPPEGGRYVKLDGGDNHTCGLWEDGEVECWGSVAGTFSKDNPPVPPTPTPTPTSTPTPPPDPTTGPPATVGPTPPGADSCVETLSANGPVTGVWAAGCDSIGQAGRYARYYSFTLAEESEVIISLESGADTYLYLRQGAGRSGAVLDENDDHDDAGLADSTDSQIVATLGAGSYTIEATTYEAGQTGGFTLTISGL